jgi:CHASE3 domain sensor protein
LPIDKKLGLAFGTLLALLLVSSGLAYLKSRKIQRTELELISSRFPSRKLRADLQRDLNQTRSQGRKLVLAGTEQLRRESAQMTFELNWKDVDKNVVTIMQPNL